MSQRQDKLIIRIGCCDNTLATDLVPSVYCAVLDRPVYRSLSIGIGAKFFKGAALRLAAAPACLYLSCAISGR